MRTPTDAGDRITAAALQLLRERGYAATSVDEICKAARLSKGAFFHLFDSKEAAALAAIDAYTAKVHAAYARVDRANDDAEARFASYLDVSTELAESLLDAGGCLLGVLARERTSSKIAERCAAAFDAWTSDLARLVGGGARARELAAYVIAVLEGSLLLAQVTGNRRLVRTSIERCRGELERKRKW